MKRFIVGTAIVCASLLSGTTAHADPLLVTGGSFTNNFSGGFWTLSGDGFSLSGGGDSIAGGLFQSCGPCTGRESLQFSVAASESPFVGGGPGTFNGVSYPTLVFEGRLDFTGPTLSGALLSPTNLMFTAPFTMTAHLIGYTSPEAEFASHPQLFETDFIGSGTATAEKRSIGPTSSCCFCMISFRAG